LWSVAIVLVALLLLFTAGYVYYTLTYVMTLQASVYCELVELGSEVDARLAELHVVPSDKVRAGQPVARLDDSQLVAALDAAKAQLEIAASALTHAKALRGQFQARLPEQIRRATAARDEMRALHEKLRKGTRAERIDALKARLDTTKERVAFYQLEVKIAQQLAESGVGSSMEMEQKRTALAVAQNENIEAQMQLKLAEAGPTKEEIEASRKSLEEREAALALALAGKGELKRLEAEVAMRQAEVARARANVDQRNANLKSKTICSPVNGTVLRTFGEVGEVCKKGEPIVFVRDDSKGHWVEGFVDEEDAYRLRPKQKATVEIVIGSWDYMSAYVDLISLSTSSVERRAASPNAGAVPGPAQGERVWVKLRFEKQPDLYLLPGMSARAFIRVR